MSFENTKCPCGGKKLEQTMLCAECVAHIEKIPDAAYDLRHYADDSYDLTSRRGMAVKLLSIAHRRKRHPALPLSFKA